MPLKEIAVVGTILSPQGIIFSPGVVTITSVPSTKLLGGGAFVYTTPLLFTVVGASAAGYQPGTVVTAGPQSIPATSVKMLSGGLQVMRLDDFVLASMLGVPVGPPSPPVPFIETWKISFPGQVKFLAM